MPFRHLTDLDLATREKMTAAFDAARVQLGIKPDDPQTANLATIIVELAATGLLDPTALSEKAVAALQQPAKSRRRAMSSETRC